MQFREVALVFESIETISSRLEITELLARLLASATPEEATIICNFTMGQLNPPYKGTQFNIADKILRIVVADVLATSVDYVTEQSHKVGDIGSVLQTGDWDITEQLTIVQVYEQLVLLEKMSGTGSQEIKIDFLKKLFEQLDQLSAKYIARIILGKLRLGFSDMTIIDALSWMEAGDKSLRKIIENAYNICADIGFIAQQLKQHGIISLENLEINVGIPIRPSAAERLPTARAIVEKLGDCVAQPKLDGFRLQMHMSKNAQGNNITIHFFSRNLLDMSYMFPEIAQAFEHLNIQSIICEGEAIVYDENTQQFLTFQETVKRKRKHSIDQMAQELPLRVYIFDLLYLNGQSFLNKTHAERRQQLMDLFKDSCSKNIFVIEEKHITTAQELENYFVSNIAAGLEGLVVKREDAIYQPGKRNFNWIKLKRQEEGHLEDTIDCVILGYYYGAGKRAQFGIGAFLVGVYNAENQMFETVAKIGTGLKDNEWHELKNKCDKLKRDNKPINVSCAAELAPDVWIDPELVVLIRADEITLSPVHKAGKTEKKLGYALRFPRIMGYRTDKSAYDATTADEVERLYQDQFIK